MKERILMFIAIIFFYCIIFGIISMNERPIKRVSVSTQKCVSIYYSGLEYGCNDSTLDYDGDPEIMWVK